MVGFLCFLVGRRIFGLANPISVTPLRAPVYQQSESKLHAGKILQKTAERLLARGETGQNNEAEADSAGYDCAYPRRFQYKRYKWWWCYCCFNIVLRLNSYACVCVWCAPLLILLPLKAAMTGRLDNQILCATLFVFIELRLNSTLPLMLHTSELLLLFSHCCCLCLWLCYCFAVLCYDVYN